MKKAAPILFIIAIFLVGAVSGGVGGYYYGRASFYRRPPKPDQMVESMHRFMTDRLALTADQSAKLLPLVQDLSKSMQAVHEENHQRMGAMMKAFDAKLTPLLTEPQLKKLEELHKERERFGRGPKPGGEGDGPKPPAGPPAH